MIGRQVLVFDSNPTRRDEHCKVLRNIGFVVWKWQDEETVPYMTEKGSPKGPPERWDLILLHAPSTDAEQFSAKKIGGPVLHYSGEGGSGTKEWVPRPVNPGSELSERELRLFTDVFFATPLATIEASIDRVWSIAPSLALRLLCEAWKFVAEKKPSHGINVRGPKTPTDWFKPFGKEFPSEAGAEEIAKLMGEAEVEADALLKLVLANNDEKIEAGIISFLSKLQKAKTHA